MKTIATVAAAIVAAIAKTNRKFYRERQRVSEQFVQILFFYPKNKYDGEVFLLIGEKRSLLVRQLCPNGQ